VTMPAPEGANAGLGGLVRAGLEKLRSKLLDLSMSNRLLNFKHSDKSKTHIRIIDEIPEVLFDKLEQHKNLQFVWIEEPEFELADEQTTEFKEAFAKAKESDETYLQQKEKLGSRVTRRQLAKLDRALKDRVRVSLGLTPRSDRSVADRAREFGIDPSFDLPPNAPTASRSRRESTVQTLFYRELMESKLAAIREGDKTLLEDAGINALYTAFGFAEWYESADSEIPVFAPLVFYPVEIQRTLENGLYKYVLAARDDDIEINQAFAELTKRTAGLELPAWDTEATLSDYLQKVQEILASQRRWRVRRWVTVGLFTFAKLAMYADLDPKRWTLGHPLESHPILSDLLVGTEAVSDVTLAPDYDIDSPNLASKNHVLITDADSSQHSAVIDVLEGKSLVIQGPPGTGKSQTITNIIAAAMQSGKKILFLAEKMAALQVVKDRLDHFGLGNFCLEVHSNKTRKTTVLKSLEERVNFSTSPLDGNQLRQALDAHQQARDELIYYVTRMKENVGETGLTVHAILGANCIRVGLAETLSSQLLKVRIERPLEMNSFTRQELTELSCDLESRAAGINSWQGLSRHPWYGIQNVGLDVFQSDELLAALVLWKESIAALIQKVASVSSDTGWSLEPVLNATNQFIGKVAALPDIREEVVESIVCSVSTQTHLSLLIETVDNVEAFNKIQGAIAQYSSASAKVFELGSAHFKHAYEKAAKLNLLDANIADIEKISAEKRQRAESLCKAEEAILPVAKALGIDSPLRHDIEDILKAMSLLQLVPRRSLGYRDPAVMSEENIRDLERSAQSSEALQRLKSKISEDFHLSLVPSLEAVKQAAHALQTSGVFRKMFGRGCRGARRLYRDLAVSSDSRRKRKPGQELTRLAAYMQQARENETNKDLQRYAGRFYRGSDTPWRELVSISQWASKVRQTFPPQPNGKNPLCNFLLEADSGRIDSILAFGKTTEYEFLVQETAKSSAWSASSLMAFVAEEKAAAQLCEELASQLSGVNWNSATKLKELGTVAGELKTGEDILLNLNSDKIEKLLGSRGALWVDKAVPLRETATFLSELAKLGLPQVFWQRLGQRSVRDLIASLRRHGEDLFPLVTAVIEHEKTICSLGAINGRRWIGADNMSSVNLRTLESRIGFALENKAALQPYLDFLRVETRARTTPLAPILDCFQDSPDPYRGLDKIFELVFYRSCAESLLKEDPKLAGHSGESHEKLRKRYQQLDRKVLELKRQQIAQTLLCFHVPAGTSRGKASDLTDLALIRRQIGLQRRHVSLRDLFKRAGDAIQALKPCFMMSPMSVAQFLDPAGLRFDLVVMDEASQIRPEDAIGAIARGTQIVVVGDPKQLPPTPFFEKVDRDESSDEGSDEAEVEDLVGQESILDVTRGPYQPVRRLGWHYRSQHEGLIAFSNREFYENSLIVFPSPHGDDPEFGVRLEEVDGRYADSLNPIEAEAVVAAAQSFMRQFPQRSLGIVAMNKPQQELIQKMMDDLFATDVEAESYRVRWENTLDRVFVKNLENVQGDERDVIFISTVYGKDAAGNFYQRFGPLNGVYGHRRLNVLFTRAKQQVRLFTSMKAADIRIEENTRLGVKALKDYLAYAKSGYLESIELTGRQPDSEFEIWVMRMLTERGYEVVPQLGVAGYFIDLAIRHPDHRGTFILGIECDGATYHSARSVRDRDRLRQEVLVRLGWKIYRIWSTDWFRNPRNEFLKLVAAIESLRTSTN